MEQSGTVRIGGHSEPRPVEGRIAGTDLRHVLEERRWKERWRCSGSRRKDWLVLMLVLMLMQMGVLMLMVVQLLAQVGRGRYRAETAPVKKPIVQLTPQHVLVFRGE